MSRQFFQTSKSKYLLSCDNINKYNLKSIYNEPKVKKLISHIFLKKFLIASDFFNKTDINNNIQLKAILFLYLTYSSFPEIIFQNVKVGKSSKKRNEGDFILKLNTISKKTIDSFLSTVFTEKGQLFNSTDKTFLNKDTYLKKFNQKTFSYNVKIPGKTLFDVNEFFSSKVLDINLRQIKVDLSLVYSNIPKNADVRTILRNNFFF
jgi:hypothetical protein